MKIIIIGGGVSGLAISCKLAKEKIDNLLIEKRPFLGGRAYSFYDNNSKEEIDNGQHVIVGACKEFIKFLSEIRPGIRRTWGELARPLSHPRPTPDHPHPFSPYSWLYFL